MQRRRLFASLAAAALLCFTGASFAAYPDHPVRLIVPSGAGGVTDSLARTLAQILSTNIGQSVYVENRSGASGIVGSQIVATAPPDGYTLLMVFPSHVVNPSLFAKMPYDTVKSFAPVSLVATLPNVLLVAPNIGVNSVADLIALLKRDPARRMFASSGVGTSTHLTGELFAATIGVPLTHIPYKGTPPAMVDVSSGAVTFMFDQMTAALPLLQNGKLKLLVASDVAARGLDIPDVSHVFNYDVPIHAEDYVHRIGRTGRAGRSGKSFTIATRSDTKYVDAIERLIGKEIEWLDGDLSTLSASDSEDEAPRRGRGGAKRSSRKDGERRDGDRKTRGRTDEKAEKPSKREATDGDERRTRKAAIRSDNAERKSADEDRAQREMRGSRRRRDDEDDDNKVVGFGEDVPAFMNIPVKA